MMLEANREKTNFNREQLGNELPSSSQYGKKLDLTIGDSIPVYTNGIYYGHSMDYILINTTNISFYIELTFFLTFLATLTACATICIIFVYFWCWLEDSSYDREHLKKIE